MFIDNTTYCDDIQKNQLTTLWGSKGKIHVFTSCKNIKLIYDKLSTSQDVD